MQTVAVVISNHTALKGMQGDIRAAECMEESGLASIKVPRHAPQSSAHAVDKPRTFFSECCFFRITKKDEAALNGQHSNTKHNPI